MDLLQGHVPEFVRDSSALQKLTTRPGDNDTLHFGQYLENDQRTVCHGLISTG